MWHDGGRWYYWCVPLRSEGQGKGDDVHKDTLIEVVEAEMEVKDTSQEIQAAHALHIQIHIPSIINLETGRASYIAKNNHDAIKGS